MALVAQFRLDRYVPGVYWLSVVLISVVGTLLTDNLTDAHGVPLWISSTVFAVLLAVVFAVWYARERTLSIHSINTTPREALVLAGRPGHLRPRHRRSATGPSSSPAGAPAPSILLPAGLIAAVFVAWKLGAGPVLTFWIAYILTRPLGANIGDFFASPQPTAAWASAPSGRASLFLRRDPRHRRLPVDHARGPDRAAPGHRRARNASSSALSLGPVPATATRRGRQCRSLSCCGARSRR